MSVPLHLAAQLQRLRRGWTWFLAERRAAASTLALPAHLQEAQCNPQSQCGSMVPHLAGRTARPPRVPLVARSARPKGAARFPQSWQCARAAAAAASAAAQGGLRTRQAAGTRGARPFPRCHSDPRCLAPKPRPGLPQSKGNFLVSRQRNNAPEREGASRSQRLRLPRGREANQAAPCLGCRLPSQGSLPGPQGSTFSYSWTFTFSCSVVLSSAVIALNNA